MSYCMLRLVSFYNLTQGCIYQLFCFILEKNTEKSPGYRSLAQPVLVVYVRAVTDHCPTMTRTQQDSILSLSGSYQPSGPHVLQRSAQAQQVTQQPSNPCQGLSLSDSLWATKNQSLCAVLLVCVFLLWNQVVGFFWITCVWCCF